MTRTIFLLNIQKSCSEVMVWSIHSPPNSEKLGTNNYILLDNLEDIIYTSRIVIVMSSEKSLILNQKLILSISLQIPISVIFCDKQLQGDSHYLEFILCEHSHLSYCVVWTILLFEKPRVMCVAIWEAK